MLTLYKLSRLPVIFLWRIPVNIGIGILACVIFIIGQHNLFDRVVYCFIHSDIHTRRIWSNQKLVVHRAAEVICWILEITLLEIANSLTGNRILWMHSKLQVLFTSINAFYLSLIYLAQKLTFQNYAFSRLWPIAFTYS